MSAAEPREDSKLASIEQRNDESMRVFGYPVLAWDEIAWLIDEHKRLGREVEHLRAGIEHVHSLLSFGFVQDAKQELEALLSGSSGSSGNERA